MADAREFLERWSRLKRKAKAEPRSGAPSRPPAIVEASAPEAAAAPPPEAAAELPPLESLGKDSDYTPFMRPDVPDALRNEALRRLWGSDPVFANLDGLVEYGEDFGAAFKAGGIIATAYRVLQGMPGSDPDEPREEAQGGTASPTGAAPEGAAASPAAGPTVATAAPPAHSDGRIKDVDLE